MLSKLFLSLFLLIAMSTTYATPTGSTGGTGSLGADNNMIALTMVAGTVVYAAYQWDKHRASPRQTKGAPRQTKIHGTASHSHASNKHTRSVRHSHMHKNPNHKHNYAGVRTSCQTQLCTTLRRPP